MKAVLLRTGSVPVQSRLQSGSSRLSSGERHAASSPRISLKLETNHWRVKGIRRALSETDISARFTKPSRAGSRSFPHRIPEEDHVSDDYGSLISEKNGNDSVDSIGTGPENAIPMEYFGERSKIGEYYRKLLKSNPRDSLVLRNYGKFLQEVENDTEKAEEYYGRAILENPGDGEVLSLYGDLIWMTQRDEERAKSYFDQAVNASPDDCMVLGSYARFMWEVEEQNLEDEVEILPTMDIVAAF